MGIRLFIEYIKMYMKHYNVVHLYVYYLSY